MLEKADILQAVTITSDGMNFFPPCPGYTPFFHLKKSGRTVEEINEI